MQTLRRHAPAGGGLAPVRLAGFKWNRWQTSAVYAGVFELRVHHGPGIRVYYGRDGDLLVVLLAGGSKKRLARDIERANASWKAYR